MKKINLVFYVAMLCLLGFVSATAQTPKWAVGSQCPKCIIEGLVVAVDHSGNVYGSGVPSSFYIASNAIKCSFGADTVADPKGLVVASTDSNGNYRWEIGATSGFAEVWKLATDINDNVYLFGFFGSTLTLGTLSITTGSSFSSFCAKLNSSGNVIWLKKIADSAYCTGSVDAHGNVYVAGQFKAAHITIGTTTLHNTASNGRNSDVFVAKLDYLGNPLWATSFGGDSTENLSGIQVNSNGEVYLGGGYYSPSLSIGTDHLMAYAGAGISASPYFFIAKYDPNGNAQWGRSIKSEGISNLNNLALDPWDNLYVAGGYTKNLVFGVDSMTYTNHYQFFLIKYDKNGHKKWATTRNNNQFSGASDVAADACGNEWICGYSNGDKMYLVRYDSSGNFNDSTFIPCGGDDQCGMVIDNKGNLFFCGDYLQDTVIIGSDTLIKPDSTEETMFIAKYSYPLCSVSPILETPGVKYSSPGVTIAPNPATSECTISTNNPAIITRIDIYDLTGRIIKTILPSTITATINTAAFPPGLYTCKILTDNNAIQIEKLLIAN